jgi:hypothetical protein
VPVSAVALEVASLVVRVSMQTFLVVDEMAPWVGLVRGEALNWKVLLQILFRV